jgi:hypothetical protein
MLVTYSAPGGAETKQGMTPLQNDPQQHKREANHRNNIASRSGANGDRIQNICAESSRNHVSLLVLVYNYRF